MGGGLSLISGIENRTIKARRILISCCQNILLYIKKNQYELKKKFQISFEKNDRKRIFLNCDFLRKMNTSFVFLCGRSFSIESGLYISMIQDLLKRSNLRIL